MENEENNELIVNDVPETSNTDEKNVQDGTSENVEQFQETTEESIEKQQDIEKQIEERANKLFEEKVEQRLIRDRISREREEKKNLQKYKQLENIMKVGLGVESLDEAITKTTEYYQEQGINIPINDEVSLTERDERVLAEADAREIILLGKDEMEKEANRIASIPADKRTTREKTVFNSLCQELINIKDIDTLKDKGYQTEILNDKNFIDFRNQFNVNTSICKIYEMYQKINGQTAEQPSSPGSAKSNNSNNEIKEYYTPEEARRFNEEDLNNPKLMKALEKSMQLWMKK